MKKGFTLLELSFVIIIVGFLVAGIVAGKDLLEQAKMKGMLDQIENADRALGAFWIEYGFIPGDMTRSVATSYNLTAANAAYTGMQDGDRYLDAPMGTSTSCTGTSARLSCLTNLSGESQLFFVHLSQAGLQKEGLRFQMLPALATANLQAGVNAPTSVYGIGDAGIMSVFTSRSGKLHYLFFTPTMNSPATPGPAATNGLFTPFQAWSIDAKIDDGKGITGRVVSVEGDSCDGLSLSALGCDAQPIKCVQAADRSTYDISGADAELAVCKLAVGSRVSM